jgi:hypothetical protein
MHLNFNAVIGHFHPTVRYNCIVYRYATARNSSEVSPAGVIRFQCFIRISI